MKKFPLTLITVFLIISWFVGLYSLSVIDASTIVIPLLGEFLWMRNTQGLLGLTAIFTLLTLPVLTFMVTNRVTLKRLKVWYTLSGATNLAWVMIIFLQIKIAAYNLGICH
ncbi:hypothetical protein [Thalassobacillus sp. CUG 92003]|uniref:hypothetical protein n=1 Tax=Thalassobacillus sp. CUG 92003 TaxID=2736641 RepID=UPI0015E65EC1|nr:hypothetical protein [Thalassobacillus sp. CUG 92003]